MRSIWLCVLLNLFTVLGYAQADCQLSADQISQTNRIFAFRVGNQYYPLRLDVVRVDQTLDMICDAKNVVQTKCQANGNFTLSLPMVDCNKPVRASVEAIPDRSCPHTMYRVGHDLGDEGFLDVYRSCYDVSNATAHYTIHVIYPYKLNANRPGQGFTTDGVITGATAATFEAKSIYARFKELFGSDQTYIKSARDQVFDRGHLAPSADYVFEQNMRQTFKYINVVAKFRTINRSNWKTIENWVRNLLTDGGYEALQVCTGGLDVLQLPSSNGQLKSVYLGPGRVNPVPKWLFKIVSDGEESLYAILTYNNVHNSSAPLPPHCQRVQCPQTLAVQDTKEAGFTFCCEPNSFINKNVPHLAGVC
ncbi:uncharacterized protein LOC115621457 [Scaptodrosophila lebanonensis]|uniref:Endonuclease n=1 Tax=Drosophila lebanonensis TaxID=7225 RepID=A0A6J2T779_DROLE|nr:uncharacterized protein LOC115621457 [Scaptodrosophila lebanonensis]